MAAFKDKKNGSWYVQFRYTDWKGERRQKFKRGFATKKEAQTWEREFLMQKQADVNMTFESFVELYEKDIKPKLKLNTWLTKADYDLLKSAAKKLVVQEKNESKLQKALDKAKKMIADLTAELKAVKAELLEYKSVLGNGRILIYCSCNG